MPMFIGTHCKKKDLAFAAQWKPFLKISLLPWQKVKKKENWSDLSLAFLLAKYLLITFCSSNMFGVDVLDKICNIRANSLTWKKMDWIKMSWSNTGVKKYEKIAGKQATPIWSTFEIGTVHTLQCLVCCTVPSNSVKTFVYGTWAWVALKYQHLQFRSVCAVHPAHRAHYCWHLTLMQYNVVCA